MTIIVLQKLSSAKCFCITFILAVGFFYQVKSVPAYQAATQSNQPANAQPSSAIEQPLGDNKTSDSPNNTEPSPDKIKRSEWVQIAINAFIALVILWQAWTYHQQRKLMQRQLTAMEGQLATAQKQFEATDRAWLSVEVIPTAPLIFHEKTVQLSVRFNIKNVGRSVATRVVVEAALFTPKLSETFTEPSERQKKLLENVLSNDPKKYPPDPMAVVVFPDKVKQTFTHTYGISVQSMKDNTLAGSDSSALILAGVVDYLGTDQITHHQTGFIYDIRRADPIKRDALPFTIRIGQNVPADLLVFLEYPWGNGNYAN